MTSKLAEARAPMANEDTACPLKAVLKSPQSKRYRDDQACSRFTERLDCGAFTAAFAVIPIWSANKPPLFVSR